jgi:CheY-like chemotaxis protein
MSNNLSILILEKDTDLVKIVGPFLNIEGYSVFASTSIKSAIQKMENQRYSLICVDTSIGASQMNELIKQATRIGSLNSSTPIFVTTADLAFELPIDEAKKISRILTKPYTLPDLLGNIRELVA